jgi:hypothetical protein
MIVSKDGTQVITNDADTNAPGDYAIIRVKVGLVRSPQMQVTAEGWKLAGFSFTAKTRITGDHVCLVYRFGEPEGQRPGGAP